MDVLQIRNFVNNAVKESIGEIDLLQEDLTNLVDVGTAIFNANALDRYADALVNQVGLMIFVDRVYKGVGASVLMNNWEYGSVVEKVACYDLAEAMDDEAWELENGQSYDQNIFYQPKIEVKFFNQKKAFSVKRSFTRLQLKQSFQNEAQLNAFVSMLFNNIYNSLTVQLETLVRATVNNFIGATIVDDYGSDALNSKSGVKAINLLYLYNNTVNSGGTPLTTSNALYNTEFIKFASYMMKLTADKMKSMSKLFNIGKRPRFTNNEELRIILLSNFASVADTYLQSTTFHNEFTALPNAEIIPYWQGSGLTYDFDKASSIDIKIAQTGQAIEVSGILGVMFDRWSLGINQYDRRTTTHYNADAEFTNYFFKENANYFNDYNENFVVFFIA